MVKDEIRSDEELRKELEYMQELHDELLGEKGEQSILIYRLHEKIGQLVMRIDELVVEDHDPHG